MHSVNYRERREVAERLRNVAARGDGDGISCCHVDKALGLRYDDDYFGDVFTCDSVLRLADLIDHTGSLVLTTDGSAISRNCPECGEPIYHNVNYCPNCGVRFVAYDGEQ